MSYNRASELGWCRIGAWDSAERRSLWVRLTEGKIELCSGREGDDWYAVIDDSNPCYPTVSDVINAQVWAQEDLTELDEKGNTVILETTP